jgi:hypothetical protein
MDFFMSHTSKAWVLSYFFGKLIIEVLIAFYKSIGFQNWFVFVKWSLYAKAMLPDKVMVQLFSVGSSGIDVI